MKIEVCYTFDSNEEFSAHVAQIAGTQTSATDAPAKAPKAPSTGPSKPAAPARPQAPSAGPSKPTRTRRTDAQIRDLILGSLAENVSGLDVKGIARLIQTNPLTVQSRLDAMSADQEILTDGSVYWLAAASEEEEDPDYYEEDGDADPDNYADEL